MTRARIQDDNIDIIISNEGFSTNNFVEITLKDYDTNNEISADVSIDTIYQVAKMFYKIKINEDKIWQK